MPQSTPQAAMLRGEEKTMIRELRWKLGIAPLQLGVIQSRAQNALRRARAALKEALHRARGGWTNVGAPPLWYAEKLIAHHFALDPRRDTPMRCPRCGATGHIEHGEHRRCGCGLAMAVSGNALKVWSAGVPHYATALDAETGTTTVTEIERERAKDCYTHPPAEARTHTDEEMHRTREIRSMHAPGHRATVESVHCPGYTRRIVNSTLPSLSRWLCACGEVIHCEVLRSRTWRGRPVDRAGEHQRACWH